MELKKRPSRLKELLACVEIYWLKRWDLAGTKADVIMEAGWHLPEDIAECFSFYAFHVALNRPLKDKNLHTFDENNVINGHSLKYLLELRSVIELKKAEILIDRFDYVADRNKSEVNLRAFNDDFERSVRFSYASSEIAENNLGLKVLKDYPDTESISDIAEQLFDKLGHKLVQLKTNPERLVICLPDVPPLRDILLQQGYYREELQSVVLAMKELHIDHEEFLNKAVYQDLTFGDILRFKRVFHFLMAGINAYLRRNPETDAAILIRSIVPVMRGEKFAEFIALSMSAEKATQLLDLLSWQLSDSGIFDVQYQPIIKAEACYMLPYNLIAQSNLLRNVLLVSRFRFDATSEVDPVTNRLATTLRNQGFLVVTNRKYSHGESAGDIDVLATRDGYLFVFECKGSVHPAGVAELRTSFDYMEKGAEQLTRFQQVINDRSFRNSLLKSLKWEQLSVDRIITCIVMGNRMFTGLFHRNHAVRPLHSLLAFIEKGEISFSDRIERLWLNDIFTAEDLYRYIIDNIMHGPLMNLMVPHTFTHRVAGKCLNIHTFAMDVSSLMPGVKQEMSHAKD